PALEETLKQAEERGERFDVVHFDGHGVFDSEHGLGALCFEDPRDTDKLEQRASQLIDAEKLAAVMRDYRIPLVFLEACQTAKHRQLRLGALPELPHQFQGRSRELLKLERLLSNEPYAVVRGQGGAGKTTLAAELARWLVRARRFRRAAFVSLEQYSEARSVL